VQAAKFFHFGGYVVQDCWKIWQVTAGRILWGIEMAKETSDFEDTFDGKICAGFRNTLQVEQILNASLDKSAQTC
jgi:hypothetical protein